MPVEVAHEGERDVFKLAWVETGGCDTISQVHVDDIEERWLNTLFRLL